MKIYKKPDWAIQQLYRADSGLLEDICKHGVGHPNKEWLNEHDPKRKTGLDVHGCCGCCMKREDFKRILNKRPTDREEVKNEKDAGSNISTSPRRKPIRVYKSTAEPSSHELSVCRSANTEYVQRNGIQRVCLVRSRNAPQGMGNDYNVRPSSPTSGMD